MDVLTRWGYHALTLSPDELLRWTNRNSARRCQRPGLLFREQKRILEPRRGADTGG